MARGATPLGLGDQLIGTGLARGAAARGKRIAFGTGGKTCWDTHSAEIFRGNPNIALPGTEGRPDVEWIDYRRGHRLYNEARNGRWIWKPFRPVPGEVFFDKAELAWAAGLGRDFIVIEPNIEAWKSWAANKTWVPGRYDAVAAELSHRGHEIVQFVHGRAHMLVHARLVKAPSFRHALAAMQRATLYIGPEGGMHHGAAAAGIPGVVLFGGFVPPSSTGYDSHINLTGGAEACGSFRPCDHCRRAMQAIGIDQVLEGADWFLEDGKAWASSN